MSRRLVAKGAGVDREWRHLGPRVLVGCASLVLWALLCEACGLGTYEDTGSPEPGQSWPWVCPETGMPAPEAGCGPKDSSPDEGCERGKGDGRCE